MKILRIVLSLFAATWPLLAESPPASERAFQNPAAIAGQRRYGETLQRARAAYAAELEPATKAALAAGTLEEANAFNNLRRQLQTGMMPPIPGANTRVAAANEARGRFEKNVAAARKQYAADLQTALNGAMAAGQLEEANGINAELKSLTPASAAPGVAPVSPVAMATPAAGAGRSGPGLMITRYGLHPAQKDGNAGTGYVPYTEFGQPLGAAHNAKSISKWTKDIRENAVVAGFIRIEQAGSYDFKSASGYDRNELLIDGKIVCAFRDGEDKICTVDLTAGLHPIVSVGYAHATTEVRVLWKPPKGTEMKEIPNNLLSH